jgi:hypothetical protein
MTSETLGQKARQFPHGNCFGNRRLGACCTGTLQIWLAEDFDSEEEDEEEEEEEDTSDVDSVEEEQDEGEVDPLSD